jgi:ATP-dependent Clp protease ATP-binding subunit ClpA
MITTRYVQVWMMAKRAMWRLRHRSLTSEHLLYACLRLHDERHWELCRDLPVTAEAVWSHLKQNPPSEASEDFSGVQLGVSAKTALERAEAGAAQQRHSMTGTNSLMRALLSESVGPVRSLLDATWVFKLSKAF